MLRLGWMDRHGSRGAGPRLLHRHTEVQSLKLWRKLLQFEGLVNGNIQGFETCCFKALVFGYERFDDVFKLGGILHTDDWSLITVRHTFFPHLSIHLFLISGLTA